MFQLSFTWKDAIRSAWVFIAVALATFVAAAEGPLRTLTTSCEDVKGCDWNSAKTALLAAAIGAMAAGAIAVKNFVLKDGSTAKG